MLAGGRAEVFVMTKTHLAFATGEPFSRVILACNWGSVNGLLTIGL